jgi:hypothetical protein
MGRVDFSILRPPFYVGNELGQAHVRAQVPRNQLWAVNSRLQEREKVENRNYPRLSARPPSLFILTSFLPDRLKR